MQNMSPIILGQTLLESSLSHITINGYFAFSASDRLLANALEKYELKLSQDLIVVLK